MSLASKARVSALLLAALLVASTASAQVWALTDAAENSDPASGSTLAVSSTLTVGANETIVVCVYNDGDSSMTGVSDGTHTYIGLTERNYSTARTRLFYALTTSAGTFTPTATFAPAAVYRGLVASSYSRTGTSTVYVTENGSNAPSSSVDSGTLTSTGSSSLLTVACATSAGLVAQSAHGMYGMAATLAFPTSLNQTYWYLQNHSSASGSATATLATGDAWVVVAAVFNSTTLASSGGPKVGSVAAVGAGR